MVTCGAGAAVGDGQVACKEHIALIFIDQGPSSLVGNEQLGISIFHHEVEALLGIAGVERLIGATGLEHAKRGNGHPLATRNEHGHHVFLAQSLGGDMGRLCGCSCHRLGHRCSCDHCRLPQYLREWQRLGGRRATRWSGCRRSPRRSR